MKIHVFDIRWRIERSNLPDVLNYDCTIETYLKKHPKHIGEPLRRLIRDTYSVNPIFFKYVLGNSHRFFTYEFTGFNRI